MFKDDIIARIQGLGLGVYGTNLFVTSNAQLPAPAVVSGEVTVQFIETGGTDPDFIQNSASAASRNPAGQFTFRSDDPEKARAKADAYFDAMCVRNTTINAVFYKWIRPLQDPFDGGPDQNGTPTVKFNIIASRNP